MLSCPIYTTAQWCRLGKSAVPKASCSCAGRHILPPWRGARRRTRVGTLGARNDSIETLELAIKGRNMGRGLALTRSAAAPPARRGATPREDLSNVAFLIGSALALGIPSTI